MAEELLNQDDSWRIGQKVQITTGPFIGFEGVIYLIDQKERLVRVMIDIFSRQSPVEVPLSPVKALDSEKGVVIQEGACVVRRHHFNLKGIYGRGS